MIVTARRANIAIRSGWGGGVCAPMSGANARYPITVSSSTMIARISIPNADAAIALFFIGFYAPLNAIV